jgi:hypothetical protein
MPLRVGVFANGLDPVAPLRGSSVGAAASTRL